MKSRWMHMSVVAASFALFGFHQENGCGGEPPPECELLVCAQRCTNGTRVDEDGCPTCECNPPPACEDLDEQACSSDPQCEPIYSDVLCDPAACAPDDTGCFRAPCQSQYLGCRERSGCEGLDELTCSADPSCAPIYGDVACDVAPCAPDDEACFRPGCSPEYLGCRERSGCEALDEYSCSSDPQCEPIYGDVACDAAPCSPDDPECFRAPCPSQYLGCRERSGCEALDESSCSSDPSCEPIYEQLACTLECRPDPSDPNGCLPCDPASIFVGCRERSGCEVLDEQACVADPACEPHYQEAVCTAECKVDPSDPNGCLPCDPIQIFSGCHPAGECGVR